MNTRKVQLLISIGIFIVAIPQIVGRYLEIPDFSKGILTGLGIGLLFIGIIRGNYRKAD